MRKNVDNQNGFALIVTIIALAVMAILGFNIIGVTSAHYKMTREDGKSQSTYYIAEAGANYMMDRVNEKVRDLKEWQEEQELQEFLEEDPDGNKPMTKGEFFQYIEDAFLERTFTLSDFQVHGTEEPEASVTVTKEGSTVDSRDYKIISVGTIGSSKRTVNLILSIGWIEKEDEKIEILDDLLFYSTQFSFSGTSANADRGAIVIDGVDTHHLNGGNHLNISNIYFNGPVTMNDGSASFGNKEYPGTIYVKGDLELWRGERNVYGDVWVDGNFRLKDAIMHGNVYVNGDLILDWEPVIHKNVYYTGEIRTPDNYYQSIIDKCIKVDRVDSFTIPGFNFRLREDQWYINNGYEIRGNEKGEIPAGAKWLVDNYHHTNWQPISGATIIISKGDIVLRGGKGFTGALVAPNGRVEYGGDGDFHGVIISKEEIKLYAGGNNFYLKRLRDIFGDNIPVTAGPGGGSSGNDDGGSAGSTEVIVYIKSNIREE